MRTVVRGSYELNGDRHTCVISRGKWGHFYVSVDGKVVHRKLNAEWLACWFAGVFFETSELGARGGKKK